MKKIRPDFDGIKKLIEQYVGCEFEDYNVCLNRKGEISVSILTTKMKLEGSPSVFDMVCTKGPFDNSFGFETILTSRFSKKLLSLVFWNDYFEIDVSKNVRFQDGRILSCFQLTDFQGKKNFLCVVSCEETVQYTKRGNKNEE